MAWETRTGGKKYFYRSKRQPDGKIVKVYFGSGPMAEDEAARMEQDRLDRKRHKLEFQQMLDMDAKGDSLFRMAEMELAKALNAAGFHNCRSRGWRRARMSNMKTTVPTQEQPQQPEAPDMKRFQRAVKAAKRGSKKASRELLDIFSKFPHLAGEEGNMAARALWHWIHQIAGKDKHLHQALLCRLKENRLQFAREGDGTLIEAMIVDQVMITWLELYFFEVKELTHPATNIEYHEYRARRIDQLSRRHLRSLQLLARIRTNKTETVRVENIVVNSTTVKQNRKRRRSPGKPVNRIAQLVDGLDPVLQN